MKGRTFYERMCRLLVKVTQANVCREGAKAAFLDKLFQSRTLLLEASSVWWNLSAV